MLIEIKNIPNGQKLKHINIEMSFDQDDIDSKTIEISSNVTSSAAPLQPSKRRENTANNASDCISEEVNCIVPDISDRDQVDLPKEMEDLVI